MDPCDWTPAVARKHDFWCVLEPRTVLFRGLWQLCCKNVSLQQTALLTCLCFACGSLVRRFLLLALLLPFLLFFLPSFFFSTAFTSVDAFLRFCFALGICGVREELAGSCTDISLSVLRSPKKAIQDQETSRTSQATYAPARPPGHPPARAPVHLSARPPPGHGRTLVGNQRSIVATPLK